MTYRVEARNEIKHMLYDANRMLDDKRKSKFVYDWLLKKMTRLKKMESQKEQFNVVWD
jgi:hypothetical protein